jgi:major cell surface glycoprotein (TIGR04216 family)
MSQTDQSRAVLLSLLLVGAAVGGTVSLATAASVSPTTSDVAAQERFSAEVETYNGQVAVEDRVVSVAGESSTDTDVVVVFVGSRGSVIASALTVSGDRFFATLGLEGMEEGFVDGLVLASGSDETFGTPGDGPDASDDLVDYANDLADRELTQDQIREVLLQVTVDGDASDDLLVDVPFVLTQGDIRINDVVPVRDEQASGIQPVPTGETMLVRGVTNRRPSNVLIEVTADGPNETQLDTVTVDDWETDGVWMAEITVPSDAPTGTYTVEADDGQRSARTDVQVVTATTPTPTATPTTTAASTSTATAAPTQTTTDGSEPTPTPEPTPPPTTTETQSPGFGVLAALAAVVLVAAGLQRRR